MKKQYKLTWHGKHQTFTVEPTLKDAFKIIGQLFKDGFDKITIVSGVMDEEGNAPRHYTKFLDANYLFRHGREKILRLQDDLFSHENAITRIHREIEEAELELFEQAKSHYSIEEIQEAREKGKDFSIRPIY